MSQSKTQSTTEPLIRIKGLYKIFGSRPKSILKLIKQGLCKEEIMAQTNHVVGLEDINLTIEKGEIFVVMGLSASGKSTLIRHFNRLIEPTAGSIMVGGVDIMQLGKKELVTFRRHKVSMVFQRFGLMPHRTVEENVAYGLKIRGVAKKQALEKTQKWLETVGLAGYEKQYPSQLSGGQQQRVGLARALCTDADILLMDEAFSALDPLIRSELQEQLILLQEKLHKTIIFITHDLDEALRIGDRIAILKDGKLIQEGAPADILLTPADDYVESFVKDVNRARALTVQTVMQPVPQRLTAKTISGALEQMRGFKENFGYYVDADGYQGMVLQKTLEEEPAEHAQGAVNDEHFTETASISPDSMLEEVISESLDADYPLPVVNENGELQGQLSRSNVAAIFGHQAADVSELNKQPDLKISNS
jgi:glycine betaine/proline transport system ATP-binding protein